MSIRRLASIVVLTALAASCSPQRTEDTSFRSFIDIREKHAAGTRCQDIPESGAWKMSLTSDDGSVLYLDDRLFIDNDGNHAGEAVSCNTGLEKGLHHIQIRYLENNEGNNVTIKLQGKNYPEMEIPAEWLFFK